MHHSSDSFSFRQRALTRALRIAALGLTLSVACTAAFAQPATSSSETGFLDRSGLAGYEVRYVTQNGETLSYAEFERRIAGGKTFEMLKQTGPQKRATVLIGTLAGAMAAAPPAAASTEAEFRDAMGLVDYEIRYEGEDGEVLTYAEFAALVDTGKSATTTKQKGETKTALVRIADKSTLPTAPVYADTPAQPLPAFSLPALDGTVFSPAALTGRPTLINFFFADCAPCIAEIPVLNAFAKAHPAIRTLGITFDEKGDADAFVAKRKFDWTVLPNAKPLIDALGIRSYPSFALVDANGVVRALASSHEIADANHEPISPKSLAAWVDRTLDTAAVD